MIDFHCHLDLYPDPAHVARDCGVYDVHTLSVTTTPSAWIGTAPLGQGSAQIRTALGLHPQLAYERKAELPMFERLLPQTEFVGEIGLDGAPEFKPYWSDQIAVFTRILDACSRVGGRILSIHSRRAATPVLDLLEANPEAGTPILHWFSGTQRELARAVELGCWFSVGPTMLAGEKGRALTAKMPSDRLLTESDGPFARIGGQVAMPWDVGRALPYLADIWEEAIESVEGRLRQNLRRLTMALPDIVPDSPPNMR